MNFFGLLRDKTLLFQLIVYVIVIFTFGVVEKSFSREQGIVEGDTYTLENGCTLTLPVSGSSSTRNYPHSTVAKFPREFYTDGVLSSIYTYEDIIHRSGPNSCLPGGDCVCFWQGRIFVINFPPECNDCSEQYDALVINCDGTQGIINWNYGTCTGECNIDYPKNSGPWGSCED